MQLYISSIALIFVGCILILSIGDRGKEFNVLLSLGVCCAVCLSGVHYLEPITALLRRLKDLSGPGSSVLSILLKTAGIALIGELASLICSDMGQNALGKATQLLTGITILWMGTPLVEDMIHLLLEVLG